MAAYPEATFTRENLADQKIYSYLKYSSVGIEMGLSVVAGVLIGGWLDDWFEAAPWGFTTKPYMLMFWTVCGVVAGFRSIIRVARNWQKEMQEQQANHDQTPPRPD